MGDVRVPAWHSATGLHADNDRVYDAFGELLHNLPMSYTDLAARIGVSQPAVSRWASQVSHPSLGEMSAAYAAVADHLDGIREYLDRFGRVLVLIEEAVRLRAVEGARPSQPDSSPREPRRLELANRLRAALGQE
jgi:transcriptional regulator with XRE-family HTH domain